ncbi:MAG: acyltransferase [Nitrospinaceae bacterium]|nr:carbon-nitrogen hydrolase [Nitrospinaceae bacterium]NIR56820.1 carbon-nitrogen hydrolase [Nitrospinaceae bacterium]NIS87284.1 carbon-nitrogen hydrolase [Nitrospinaceae bacterium]NIT84134.1 carbon-nitrogen hydrolase [Nitrospinaceae bacterium]NIU46325.1 carbon-nitrogen hydrolase [Nitrospinaceae bacterium]
MNSKSSKENVKVGLIQMASVEDPASNLQEAERGIRQASARGAQIISLQELFQTEYFCQVEDHEYFKLAEAIPGASTEKMSQLARELEVVLIVPLFEKRSSGIYHNTAVVIDADGSVAGKYRKMHIPDDPGFYEKFYFTPGDTGFQAIHTRYGKVGVLICWDQWFPEAARLTALSGAQILFYPTAIGYQEFDTAVAPKQIEAWQTIQKAHSIANGVFTAVTNRVGPENNIKFWGQSFISDPFGEIIAQASSEEPEILVADCNLALIEETRQGWPFLRDRRVDAYQNLSRLYIDSNDT